MMRRAIVMLSLLILGSVACTAVFTPTPTTQSIAADVVTLPPRPTTTATTVPTTKPTRQPTVTPRDLSKLTLTDTPKPTFTPTPFPTATSTPSQFQPAKDIVEIMVLDDTRHLAWSPADHQFAYTTDCFLQDDPTIYFGNLANMQYVDITPEEGLECYTPDMIWHPSGEYLLINSTFKDPDRWREIHGWKVDRDSLVVEDRGRSSYVWGWLSDEVIIYQRRIGSGVYSISMFNVLTERGISGSSGFDGTVRATSNSYPILYSGPYRSVAILAQEEVSPEFEGWLFGTHVKYLSWGFDLENDEIESSLPSIFMDVLPNTDEVLVLTWEPTEEIWDLSNDVLKNGSVQADLQLWNPTTHELRLLIPNGIYGRFSPDGKHLVYMTPSLEFPELRLLNQENDEILLSHPVIAYSDYFYDIWGQVLAYTTFSPNGRFLTFYSPTPDLMIYDLESGEFLPAIAGVPFTPLWSPDNTRFVYEDGNNGFSIYEIETGATYPLAASGGERLYNPQWSFDGMYLSVVVSQGDGEAKTAVLQLP